MYSLLMKEIVLFSRKIALKVTLSYAKTWEIRVNRNRVGLDAATVSGFSD